MSRLACLVLPALLLALAPGGRGGRAAPERRLHGARAPSSPTAPAAGSRSSARRRPSWPRRRPTPASPSASGPTRWPARPGSSCPARPNSREVTIEAVGPHDRPDRPRRVRPGRRARPRRPPSPTSAPAAACSATTRPRTRRPRCASAIPAFHRVLVQVGRRGRRGSADDERALLTLEEIALAPLEAPPGDRASTATPRIGRRRRVDRLPRRRDDVARGSRPSRRAPRSAGVWRRVTPAARRPPHVHRARRSAWASSASSPGRSPEASQLLGCVDRDGPGALVLPVRARTRAPLWVRLGTDRPSPESEALAHLPPRAARRRRVRRRLPAAGDRLDAGRAAARRASSRRVKLLSRTRVVRAVAARLRRPGLRRAHRAARPGRHLRTRAARCRRCAGRGQLVLLPRVRRLRARALPPAHRGRAASRGIRRRVPSTVLFRLR